MQPCTVLDFFFSWHKFELMTEEVKMCVQNCYCSVQFGCLELDLGRFCTYLEREEE